MRFQILGPVRVLRGEGELDAGPGKQRAVLAALLLQAGRPVATSQIIRAVWPDDPPENGANVVQKYIAGLRRVLDPGQTPRSPQQLLALTEAGYVLRVDAEHIDAEAFQRMVREATVARTEQRFADAAVELRAALAMCDGEPLAGLSGPVFEAARARLVEARGAALEAWAETELRLGHHRDIVADLIRLVRDFPLREQLRGLLMLALYRCGRQAEALAAFREARTLLHDEYGIEPGEALQELHRQILRSDAALTAEATLQAGTVDATRSAHTPPTPPDPLPAVGDAVSTVDRATRVSAADVFAHGSQASARAVRPRWVTWLETGLGVSLVLISFGALTWTVMLYYAGQRRNRWLGLTSLAYLTLIGLFVTAMEFSNEEVISALDMAGLLGLAMAWLGGAVHVVLLNERLGSFRRPAPVSSSDVARRSRREQARHLLYHRPEARHELLIGRPDLPRAFDDGGLIDVNAVPESVLAGLPELTPQQARHVATERWLRGPFVSIEELAARCLLPLSVSNPLREILLFLSPAPSPSEPTQTVTDGD